MLGVNKNPALYDGRPSDGCLCAAAANRPDVKRRWFAVMGAVLPLLIAVMLFRLGPPATVDPTFVLLGLASILLVFGGVNPAPDAVPWYRFVGLAFLLLGAVSAGYWIEPAARGGRTTADLAFALVGLATALVFAFIGIDWFRGGRHLDLSRIEHGPILGRGDEPDEG